MKRIVVIVSVLGAVVAAGVARLGAEEKTLEGVIGASHCGAGAHQGVHKGKKVSDRECIVGIDGDPSYKSCLAYGSKFVFISEGKVFTIANQDLPDLRTFAADTVRIKGDLNGDTITIASVVRRKDK